MRDIPMYNAVFSSWPSRTGSEHTTIARLIHYMHNVKAGKESAVSLTAILRSGCKQPGSAVKPPMSGREFNIKMPLPRPLSYVAKEKSSPELKHTLQRHWLHVYIHKCSIFLVSVDSNKNKRVMKLDIITPSSAGASTL